MFLHAKRPSCLSTPACGFLARQVAHSELAWIDHQAPAVDEHLRLARSRLDNDGALENGGDPDAPTVNLSFEVGKDLVVLVHLDGVEANELTCALQRVCSSFSV
jgi:hypothetical protein